MRRLAEGGAASRRETIAEIGIVIAEPDLAICGYENLDGSGGGLADTVSQLIATHHRYLTDAFE